MGSNKELLVTTVVTIMPISHLPSIMTFYFSLSIASE